MIKRLVLLAPLALLAACNGAANSAATGGPATSAPAAGSEELALMPPPRPGTLAPAALKGMSAGQAEHALGRPGFVRKDPPAEIWQYRVKACTLDLFLYEENGRRSVAHYAVRVPGGGTISESACLDEVLERRDGTPVS
ncbi:MAG: hypothetical protein HY055_11385 [Magnetospirillum sp.]|nr:hypothetical protein [Magnetospirillum sp.]